MAGRGRAKVGTASVIVVGSKVAMLESVGMQAKGINYISQFDAGKDGYPLDTGTDRILDRRHPRTSLGVWGRIWGRRGALGLPRHGTSRLVRLMANRPIW